MGIPASHLGIILTNGNQEAWPDTTILRRKGKRSYRAQEEGQALASLIERPLELFPPEEKSLSHAAPEKVVSTQK